MQPNKWDKLYCPKCGSERTTIFPEKGWEKIQSQLVGLRKYGCSDCNHCFRAGDRRRFSREGPQARKIVRRTIDTNT